MSQRQNSKLDHDDEGLASWFLEALQYRNNAINTSANRERDDLLADIRRAERAFAAAASNVGGGRTEEQKQRRREQDAKRQEARNRQWISAAEVANKFSLYDARGHVRTNYKNEQGEEVRITDRIPAPPSPDTVAEIVNHAQQLFRGDDLYVCACCSRGYYWGSLRPNDFTDGKEERERVSLRKLTNMIEGTEDEVCFMCT